MIQVRQVTETDPEKLSTEVIKKFKKFCIFIYFQMFIQDKMAKIC